MVHMDVKFFDTGQHMTYPFLFIVPFFIKYLLLLFHAIKPHEANMLLKIFKQDLKVPHMPYKRMEPCKQWKKVKLKPRVSTWQRGDNTTNPRPKLTSGPLPDSHSRLVVAPSSLSESGSSGGTALAFFSKSCPSGWPPCKPAKSPTMRASLFSSTLTPTLLE